MLHAAASGDRAALRPGPRRAPAPGLGPQIRQRCLAFCQALEFHHVGEAAEPLCCPQDEERAPAADPAV
ncbi:hypothetical protein [Streptomyces sp. BpilaLS-43]|uniref:hypothetical protein n=1 Tax=Streptomyces sp. BpilaLS-43 TaxID=1839778 RepID=UPI000AE44AC5|nr:hypothetical protein [Streptomyces sp. BpilaLS-43]